MTAKIKLNAASGGGSVSLEAPTSTTGNANVEFKLPVADGTSGQALTTNASGQLAFATVSSAIQTTSGTDNFTIADGNLVIGTSGHGIDFSAAGNISGMTNELLDDYEEGTFTPYPVNGWGILNGSALDNGSSADVAQGKYVKIGATVYVFFTFKEGNSSGASFQGSKILFYGMPYQSEGQYGTGSDVEAHPLNGFGNNLSSNGVGLFFRPDSSGSTVGGCHAQTSTGQTDFTGQHLSNAGQIWFHGTYKVHP